MYFKESVNSARINLAFRSIVCQTQICIIDDIINTKTQAYSTGYIFIHMYKKPNKIKPAHTGPRRTFDWLMINCTLWNINACIVLYSLLFTQEADKLNSLLSKPKPEKSLSNFSYFANKFVILIKPLYFRNF